MLNFLFLDFNFLSNFQLDCTIFTILDYIININYLTGLTFLSIAIITISPIYLGSFREGTKRVWDGTKWISAGAAFGVGEYGSQFGIDKIRGLDSSGNNAGGNSSNNSGGGSSSGNNSGGGSSSGSGEGKTSK